MTKKIILLFILLSVTLSGCSILEEPDPNLYTGSVSSDEITLSSEHQGKIIEKHFSDGDVVKQGDLIYTIESTQLKNELEILKIKKEIAQLTYDDLKSGINDYDLKAALSKINAIDEQLNALANDYSFYKDIYEDHLALYESDAITKNTLEQSKQKVDSIEQQMNVTQAEKDAAVNQYNSLKNNFSYETIEKAKKELKIIDQEMKTIKDQIEKNHIKAPINGRIQTLNYDVGEIVTPNANLGKIIAPEPLYITVFIPEKYLKELYLGKKVIFIDDFINEDVTGEIVYIANQAEFTPKNVESKENKQEMVFQTKIKINNSQNILPGMFLTVDISGDSNE